jgi:cardiolipin synthase
VDVRVMADGIGQILDWPQHALKSHSLLRKLEDAGVEVESFHPAGQYLKVFNRLHCKVCAIDTRTVFLGGSNIGDYYPTWEDYNFRLDGQLGHTFHQIFEYIRSFSNGYQSVNEINLSNLFSGDYHIRLTLPDKRRDVRQAFLRLIRNADHSIYIRTWYFLPDEEIIDAIQNQAENGVGVHLMLSHKTRVPPVDYANIIPCHKLAKSGVLVYRYNKKYMHAKVAWNDHGEILLGSANLDNVSLRKTFECCIYGKDVSLVQVLQQVFEKDTYSCICQTPEYFKCHPALKKIRSYVCNLTSPWL